MSKAKATKKRPSLPDVRSRFQKNKVVLRTITQFFLKEVVHVSTVVEVYFDSICACAEGHTAFEDFVARCGLSSESLANSGQAHPTDGQLVDRLNLESGEGLNANIVELYQIHSAEFTNYLRRLEWKIRYAESNTPQSLLRCSQQLEGNIIPSAISHFKRVYALNDIKRYVIEHLIHSFADGELLESDLALVKSTLTAWLDGGVSDEDAVNGLGYSVDLLINYQLNSNLDPYI